MRNIICLILVTIAASGYGQTLELAGTIRPRTEFRNGFKSLDNASTEPAFFTEQRSRMNLNYKAEKFRLGFALQDIRIWGATAQINKTDGYSSMHEVWGEYFITPKFSVKVGRQELDYDDSRILGNLDWAQQGRSHDLIKVVYQDSSWAFHAGAAYNQDNLKAEGAKIFSTIYDVNGLASTNYKQFHYIWFGKQLKSFNISFLGINNGLQLKDSSEKFNQTIGTNATYNGINWLLMARFITRPDKMHLIKT